MTTEAPKTPARPLWVNALLAFCLFLTFIYMPYDMFWKSVAEDQEVWFGFVVRGWAAKATEPIHWVIYGALSYGLWNMRPWMRFWGTVYAAQVAFSMAVWPILDERAPALWAIPAGAIFGWLTWKYWQAAEVFERNG